MWPRSIQLVHQGIPAIIAMQFEITDARPYPLGDEAPTDQLLNYSNNVWQTVAVGSYPSGASPYGVFDMAGHVWEWTATRWVANYVNYADAVYNGNEGGATRTLRGGSWVSANNNLVGSTNRDGFSPGYRYSGYGFRVVFASGG